MQNNFRSSFEYSCFPVCTVCAGLRKAVCICGGYWVILYILAVCVLRSCYRARSPVGGGTRGNRFVPRENSLFLHQLQVIQLQKEQRSHAKGLAQKTTKQNNKNNKKTGTSVMNATAYSLLERSAR